MADNNLDKRYIASLDIGTTSVRCFIYDVKVQIVGRACANVIIFCNIILRIVPICSTEPFEPFEINNYSVADRIIVSSARIRWNQSRWSMANIIANHTRCNRRCQTHCKWHNMPGHIDSTEYVHHVGSYDWRNIPQFYYVERFASRFNGSQMEWQCNT